MANRLQLLPAFTDTDNCPVTLDGPWGRICLLQIALAFLVLSLPLAAHHESEALFNLLRVATRDHADSAWLQGQLLAFLHQQGVSLRRLGQIIGKDKNVVGKRIKETNLILGDPREPPLANRPVITPEVPDWNCPSPKKVWEFLQSYCPPNPEPVSLEEWKRLKEEAFERLPLIKSYPPRFIWAIAAMLNVLDRGMEDNLSLLDILQAVRTAMWMAVQRVSMEGKDPEKEHRDKWLVAMARAAAPLKGDLDGDTDWRMPFLPEA